MLEPALKWLLAYLLGALLGALLVGRLRGVDIRELGSGNAGGTNALRTQGKAFGLAVLLIDLGKGWLATAVLPGLALPGIAPSGALSPGWIAAGCAAAAVVGHVYPVWYGFRGGKGAATLVGALLGLAPALVLPVLGVWLLVLVTTGYVGLSTVLAVAALPILVAMEEGPPSLFWLGIAAAVFVAWTHRSNFARMRSGTESRARRVWLFQPRR